jgi:hypothetical protein
MSSKNVACGIRQLFCNLSKVSKMEKKEEFGRPFSNISKAKLMEILYA